jgi:unsaturated rhamnogalacturonyl hydrolase
MQPFQLEIPLELSSIIAKEGLKIKMIKGTKPFWFFIQQEGNKEIPNAFLPHLLVSNEGFNEIIWKEQLLSLSSLSTFGWMEGCVLDAINMLKNTNANLVLQQHLNKYFSNDSLVYEAYNNERATATINNIESILPFAILAMHNPKHAMLNKAIDYCLAKADKAGVIMDDEKGIKKLKTEECYTLCYPLVILAKKLNRLDLQRLAITNLQIRVSSLVNDNFIYQNKIEFKKPEFANWARGVAWYLLGLTKTLALLPDDETTKPLRTALQDAANMVISYQQTNGLWYCFLHEPETEIETSGSSGIAAALAYGYSKKLLPLSCKIAAEKCLNGLQQYFTPDGFLTGTAQVNKGGAALQRNGFRVISPYTLGFIGILQTSLNKT